MELPVNTVTAGAITHQSRWPRPLNELFPFAAGSRAPTNDSSTCSRLRKLSQFKEGFMGRRSCVVGLMFSCLSIAVVPVFAQTSPQFRESSLEASATSAEWAFLAFATVSEGPAGSSGVGVLNAFNLSTGDFFQCSAETFSWQSA